VNYLLRTNYNHILTVRQWLYCLFNI